MSPKRSKQQNTPVQVLLVQVPSEVARQAKELVGSAGYGSFSELVVTALQNQLLLHGVVASDKPGAVDVNGQLAAVGGRGLGGTAAAGDLFEMPAAPPGDLLPIDHLSGNGRLFVLTNRLAPLKIAARVLANLHARDGRWPQVERFRVEAAVTARALGIRLRDDDERRDARGSARRAVGLPIGPDAEKAMNRYMDSFTLTLGGGGPMTTLGLAATRLPEAVLTNAGWRLAVAPSPLLGEIEGESVGGEERQILLECLARAPEELEAVHEFMRSAKEAGPKQDGIDRLLGERNSRWSRNRIVAERASQVGRLKDLGLVAVEGRGTDAQILLTAEGERFLQLAYETAKSMKAGAWNGDSDQS